MPRNALASMHTHPIKGEDQPSPADQNVSKTNKMQGYVVSRSGLWHTDVDGKVSHVFQSPSWFADKNPK
jgi:hypothetical protein